MLGEGIGPIFLDQLMCNGSEASLLECLPSENIGLHNCRHDEDAGVRCEGLCVHYCSAKLLEPYNIIL